MPEEVTGFLNLPVYTSRGTYVGTVSNVILDLDAKRVGSLLVTNTNPGLVDGARDVAVPFRWVEATGDIVVLNNFPEHVTVHEETMEEFEEATQ